MDVEIRVRPAVREDLEAVRQVLVETWHDTYDPLIGREKVDEITGKWHEVSVLAGQLDGPGTLFLVAECDGQIVGHVFADARRLTSVQLARLYVLPSYQRRGIGTRLLAAVAGSHTGANRLRLNVEADNTKAVNFYRGQGFVAVGRMTADGLECLEMVRVSG